VEASETYIEYLNIFNNILRIKNPLPEFSMVSYSKTYDSVGSEFPLTNLLLLHNGGEFKVSEINNLDGLLTGLISVRYTVDGINWTAELPINVGVYFMKVIYTEGINDQYSSVETGLFNSIKYNIVPKSIIIVPDANSKIYDGLAVDGNNLTYTFKYGAEPYDNYQVSGSLTVVDNSKQAKAYKITYGTISFGQNYEITLDTEPVYFTIEKRPITPIFENVIYIYDGNEKTPSIFPDPNEIVTGDTSSDVMMSTSRENSNINSGSFKISVIISNISNYKLSDSAEISRTYVIEPAEMTKNAFEGTFVSGITEIKVEYDGEKHEVKLSSFETGAEFKYYLLTQSEGGTISEPQSSYTEIGEYLIEVVVTKTNYNEQRLRALLKIVKGSLDVDIIPPKDTLYYGNPLPSLSTLSKGYVVLDQDQELKPGVGSYSWTFTPFDEEHYLVIKGYIQLTVQKAAPVVKIDGSLDQIEGAVESLSVKVYVDSQEYNVTVRLYYRDSAGQVYYNTPTSSGTYSMFIEVDGNEYIEAQQIQKEFVVKTKPIIWPYIVGGVLIGLFLIIVIIIGSKKKSLVK
ncbi:MAG: hypothetical protein LBF68_05885, partial [Christensenellaceae bacterium]|nr:hypothetical protein [Christensenellaceae bacterium]